jgi:hypothetical protein
MLRAEGVMVSVKGVRTASWRAQQVSVFDKILTVTGDQK